MPNQIILINTPNNINKTITGTTASDDYIKLDRSTVTSSFSKQVLNGIGFDANNNPVYLVTDALYNTNTDLTLPPLNSPNAIEFVSIVGSPNQVFDGLYKISAPGDYTLSNDPYLMIGTNSQNSVLKGQDSSSGVAILVGGAGNDQVTGAGGSSVLFGLGGVNHIISRGTDFDNIRGITYFNGNDTIQVESNVGEHRLQIYMDDTKPQLVYLEKFNADLVGKVTDSSGKSYSFKIVDQYAGKSLQSLYIYSAISDTSTITENTTGIYLGGDLTDFKNSATARALSVGDASTDTFDYRESDRVGANAFGNAGNDILYSKANFHFNFYAGSGVDTAVFINNYADYTLRMQTSTWAKVTTPGNTTQDWLYNSEILQFKDQSIYLMADGTTRSSLSAKSGEEVYFGGQQTLLNGTGTSKNIFNYQFKLSEVDVIAASADHKTIVIQTSEGIDLLTQATDFVFTDGAKTLATFFTSQTDFVTLNAAGTYTLAEGTANNDKLIGTFNGDYFKGGSGDDQITGFSGNDFADGGTGTDTLVLSSNASRYTLELSANGSLSLENKLTGDMTLAINMEKLKFQDKTISVEQQSHGSYADLPESLWHFFIVAFNAAPGVTYMDQLAEAYRYGLSVKQIVDIFTSKSQFTDVYPTSYSHQELAMNLVSNIVKESASASIKQSAVDDIKAALDLGWSVGDVVYTVFGNLAKKPLDDAMWGNTAKQFINEIAVSKYYTEVLNQSTTDLETLRDVIQPVTQSTDVSSDVAIAQLIGVALISGGTIP